MRYKPNLKPALKQISFSVEPGMRVAIVGRTGAGKSSIYQLLTGFRHSHKGSVFIDGQDISKISQAQVRLNTDVVLQ